MADTTWHESAASRNPFMSNARRDQQDDDPAACAAPSLRSSRGRCSRSGWPPALVGDVPQSDGFLEFDFNCARPALANSCSWRWHHAVAVSGPAFHHHQVLQRRFTSPSRRSCPAQPVSASFTCLQHFDACTSTRISSGHVVHVIDAMVSAELDCRQQAWCWMSWIWSRVIGVMVRLAQHLLDIKASAAWRRRHGYSPAQ